MVRSARKQPGYGIAGDALKLRVYRPYAVVCTYAAKRTLWRDRRTRVSSWPQAQVDQRVNQFFFARTDIIFCFFTRTDKNPGDRIETPKPSTLICAGRKKLQ